VQAAVRPVYEAGGHGQLLVACCGLRESFLVLIFDSCAKVEDALIYLAVFIVHFCHPCLPFFSRVRREEGRREGPLTLANFTLSVPHALCFFLFPRLLPILCSVLPCHSFSGVFAAHVFGVFLHVLWRIFALSVRVFSVSFGSVFRMSASSLFSASALYLSIPVPSFPTTALLTLSFSLQHREICPPRRTRRAPHPRRQAQDLPRAPLAVRAWRITAFYSRGAWECQPTV